MECVEPSLEVRKDRTKNNDLELRDLDPSSIEETREEVIERCHS